MMMQEPLLETSHLLFQVVGYWQKSSCVGCDQPFTHGRLNCGYDAMVRNKERRGCAVSSAVCDSCKAVGFRFSARDLRLIVPAAVLGPVSICLFGSWLPPLRGVRLP